MSARAVRFEVGSRAAARLAAAPAPVLVGAAVVIEWTAVLALALVVRHNGWIYYQGGDQLWYYTLGHQLAHGELWQTPVGYLWSFVLAPFALAGGASLATSLPAIVLFNVLVLLPLAMVLLYGIAVRLAGRLFGIWVLVLWLALPFVGILYTNVGYHQRYTELLLPQAFGLTAMADFPTMVAVLAMLYFAVRFLTDRAPSLLTVAASGTAAGLAIALKPSTAAVLAGPVIAFAVTRRPGALLAFGAALLPAVFTLAVWKARGLGSIPLLDAVELHRAGNLAATVAAFAVDRYFGHLSWARVGRNIDLLREHFWSGHVVVWAFVAGLVGIGRRSWTLFALLAGSALPFVLLKSAYPEASIEDASLFRILMPAFPLFVLAVASLPFLWPGTPRLDTVAGPTLALSQRTRVRILAAALVAGALVPAVVMAAVDTEPAHARAAILSGTQMPVPVDVEIGLRAQAGDGVVHLTWDDQRASAHGVIYRVWRMRRDGLQCDPGPGAANCRLSYEEVGATREPVYDDLDPPAGRWTYRIGVVFNWLDDPAQGDVYFVSRPLVVDVG